MKSWRSRIAAGLAVGAAVVAIPLTATTASAAPPPGDGWVLAGGERYPTKEACEAGSLDWAHQNGYNKVWCDGANNTVMNVYFHA